MDRPARRILDASLSCDGPYGGKMDRAIGVSMDQLRTLGRRSPTISRRAKREGMAEEPLRVASREPIGREGGGESIQRVGLLDEWGRAFTGETVGHPIQMRGTLECDDWIQVATPAGSSPTGLRLPDCAV